MRFLQIYSQHLLDLWALIHNLSTLALVVCKQTRKC